MATFPNILPNRYKVKSNKPLLKSEAESGYIQQRPRTTRTWLSFELGYDNMSDVDYATMETFFNDNNGLTFDYYDKLKDTTYIVQFDDMDSLDGTYNVKKLRYQVDIKLREV